MSKTTIKIVITTTPTKQWCQANQQHRETLPTPPSDVTLTELPGRRMAAVRFNGNAPDRDLAAMEAKLNDWIKERGYTPVGSIEYAFYDAPMVPGPLRRNEVMVEVAAE